MKAPSNESRAAPEQWELVSSQMLHEYAMFRTRRDRVRSPADGSEHRFDIAESPEAVTILALTDAGEFVTVEQFRHGTREVILEFPGGVLDPGEEPLECGVRELREETGYTGGEAEYLGTLQLNPAWQNTRNHLVRVRGVRRAGGKDLDEGEETHVRLATVEELLERVRSGGFDTAVAVAALAVHLWKEPENGAQRR